MKQKSKTIPNMTIINSLTNAGLVPESRYGKKHKIKTYSYYNGTISNSGDISYHIPIDIYNKVIGKKFFTKYKLSSVVRVRKITTRENQRNQHKQDVGNIYNWGHLGIGSGRNYADYDIFKTTKKYMYNINDHFKRFNKLTIGQKYVKNFEEAVKKAALYQKLGYRMKNPTYTWDSRINAEDLYDYTKLEPSGLFGPKQIINGYITEIYIHFLYPKWKYKREARYKITFDTGAVGIFTADMLDRVFDTDFDIDERLSYCDCNLGECDHLSIHIGTDECDTPCPFTLDTCTQIFNYNKLCETTVQRGIIDEEEDDVDTNP